MRHDGSEDTGELLQRVLVLTYKVVLQYITVDAPTVDWPRLDRTFANAARRCALVQPAVCAAANGESYPKLTMMVREIRVFGNYMEGGANAGTT